MSPRGRLGRTVSRSSLLRAPFPECARKPPRSDKAGVILSLALLVCGCASQPPGVAWTGAFIPDQGPLKPIEATIRRGSGTEIVFLLRESGEVADAGTELRGRIFPFPPEFVREPQLRDASSTMVIRAANEGAPSQLPASFVAGLMRGWILAEATRADGPTGVLVLWPVGDSAAAIRDVAPLYSATTQSVPQARGDRPKVWHPGGTPSYSGVLGPITRDAYGPGIHADATGRPVVWRTDNGSLVRGNVVPNSYGFGVGADEFGRPVHVQPVR